MKNRNPLLKLWDVIYPVLIYFVVSNVVMYLMILALQITESTYHYFYMMLQTCATAICLPVLYGFYRKDRMLNTVFQQKIMRAGAETAARTKIMNCILTFFVGAMAGTVLNYVITATGLMQKSAGYQTATAHFYGGALTWEVLGVGILIPIVEELLYRGIVYARLTDWVGMPMAMVISAMIFGGFHMNWVQFIYAFLLGMLLVYFVELTHSLTPAIFAHMGANLFTLLRVETGFLNGTDKPVLYWGMTVVFVVICVLFVLLLRRKNQNRRGFYE